LQKFNVDIKSSLHAVGREVITDALLFNSSKLILFINNLIFVKMKKINLKGISEILSSKELKNVTGGSVAGPFPPGCRPAWAPCGSQHPQCCPGTTCQRRREVIPVYGGEIHTEFFLCASL